ncbi:MAG: hypothetical protein OEU26_00050 [Candidatus Tectomicrobia bacterium]|nr:hypothetical protein [Candidatus Tectomicrobia bacterium]
MSILKLMLLCFLIIPLTSCNSLTEFHGYRNTPQTPEEILRGGDYPEEEFPALIQFENKARVASQAGPEVTAPASTPSGAKPEITTPVPAPDELEPEVTAPSPAPAPSVQQGQTVEKGGRTKEKEAQAAQTKIERRIPPPRNITLDTAVPFQITEFRRVWIAPHKNQFGDGVHGHTCEILFKASEFLSPPVPDLPPTAPVILRQRKERVAPQPLTGQAPSVPYTGQTLPGTNVPIHLQDYLNRLGVGNAGQQLYPR